MKKIIWALTLFLLLALSLSACGEQSDGGSSDGQSMPSGQAPGNSGQNTPGGIGPNNSDAGMPMGSGLNLSGLAGIDVSSLSFTSLTDFYNSEYRTQLEDALNEIFVEEFGLGIFFTVEEPNTLILNYQFTYPLSSIGLSREELADGLAFTIQETDSDEMNTLLNDMKAFQSCGLPVTVIRLNYLDSDGTLLYATDINGDGSISSPGSPALPDGSGTAMDGSGTAAGIYGSLQEWLDSSEDAALTVQAANQSLASTGILFDLTVDGNVLVYKYCLPDSFFADGLAEEEQTEAFDSMVNAGSASAETVLAMFADRYGLTPDAVRFVFCSKNGTILYSKDVTP